jgi:hypothetical protein
MKYIRKAIDEIDGPDPKLLGRVNAIETSLQDLDELISGDKVLSEHNEPAPESLVDRISTAVNALTTSSAPTTTQREELEMAAKDAKPILDRLRDLLANQLAEVEKQMNLLGAPWTPGRIPEL